MHTSFKKIKTKLLTRTNENGLGGEVEGNLFSWTIFRGFDILINIFIWLRHVTAYLYF